MKRIALSSVAALALVGCGPPPGNNTTPEPQRCESAEYLAFDPANHAPQDVRLQKIDEMLVLFADAEKAPSSSSDKADQVLAIYQDPSAALSAKVAGRKDVHFTDERANVGAKLDETIRGAIFELKAATSAQQVKIAKQKAEKAGFNRWLYLSIVQELSSPSYKHFDEAYGYLGTGPTNAEAGRKSYARIATKRDGNNGTTLASELFALVLDGACACEKALAAKGATEMAKDDDPAYAQMVRSMDEKLELVTAYSVGHELFELDAKRADQAAATVKLYEGEGYFQIIEPYMKAAGGSRAQVATELRAVYEAALTKAKANDPSWIAGFNALDLLQKLEGAYGVDVRS
ncbi:MAG: hypothetical protein HYZ28_14280 [Myxococcales bacterium]|nr:hypothetical protein [Myxococcales bacterium]